MFANIASPENIASEELDQLLANGWYRMGQNVFTTHFLCFNNCFYSALWLRVGLDTPVEDDKFKRLKKQNHFFRKEIRKASITRQHEELYHNYRQSVSFDPSESLQALLYGYSSANRFNTYEINLFDGDMLIGAGFFDLGKKSAAGIVSFYHPDYKKYSIGKYLIYSKMEFCRQQHLTYFYPGYVVPGYPAFDYKAYIGTATLQYFATATQQWLLYASFTQEVDPLKQMHRNLDAMQVVLIKHKVNSEVLHYRYFDANLDPYYSTENLFDFPVFIHCHKKTADDIFTIIVFDIRTENFCLLKCSSVITTDWFKSVAGIFSSHLLRVDRVLLSTQLPEALASAVAQKL